mgnify:CR=1 FL=1
MEGENESHPEAPSEHSDLYGPRPGSTKKSPAASRKGRLGNDNLTVVDPTHLPPTAAGSGPAGDAGRELFGAGRGTIFPKAFGTVARASEGLLPPPFWMNVR